jgi:hypothetical protein
MPTKLPDAVKRQVEEAEAIDAEIAAQAAPAPAPPPDDPPPPPPAAEPPAQAPTEENWQHKFLTLQGKYNTETATLRSQVTTLTQEIEALKAAKPAPTPEPKPAAPAPEPQKLVTQQDVETFGADLVDLMRRIVVETDAGEKARLQDQIAELKGLIPTLKKDVEQVTSATVDVKRERYFSDLEKLVPDYADINVDEAFLGWLTGEDPLSGFKRNAILQNAFNAFDHQRTAVIFNAFKQETGKTAPPPPAPKPSEGLETQVSPAGSKTPTTPTPDDGQKIWSSSEVQDFYNAVTRGDYRGRQDEARRIDAEIDKALIENRVRG